MKRIDAQINSSEASAAPAKDAYDDRDVYSCLICHDSGWVIGADGARPCGCRSAKLRRERRTAAGLTPALSGKSFADFSLAYYSDTTHPQLEVSYRRLAQVALTAAQDFAAAQIAGRTTRGLLLEGGVGSGKTLLAAAIANQLLDNGVDALFLVVPQFLDQLRYSYRAENDGEDEATIIKRAYNAPVLILDDLGAHNFSPWVQNKLFAIVDHRLNYRLPCVITTNLDLNELNDTVGERVVSRFMEMCNICKLDVDEDIRRRLD
ncbi:MAG: ATP-binding protein [Bacillota bacterium]|nr:ATP-binding protein [Bacillota bacterium]